MNNNLMRHLAVVIFSASLFILSPCGMAQTETSQSPAVVPAVTPETSENISLDFKDADINTVLRVMSLKSNVNIVTGPEVQGKVTIRLESVPWEKALQVVLRTYDYVYERDGNIIRVTTREKMALEPVMTQTFVLNYTKAKEVQDAVQDMLSERGRIKTAERTNSLVITDIPTNIYRISEIVKSLDKITPQAYIDSKVIKTDVGDAENLGIQWNVQGGLTQGAARPTTFPFPSGVGSAGLDQAIGTGISQFFPVNSAGTSASINADPRDFPQPGVANPTNSTFSFGTLSFTNFSSVLQMLRSKSNTKIVSNPRIVVLNNQTAKVQVGQQIPIPSFERNSQTGNMEVTGFSYRDVGVVLNVTPHINSAEEILVDLKPEVSAKGSDVSFGTNFTAPSFDVTTAITQVLIQSGQTIAIGGLMTDNTALDEARVPYLSDIPLVGKLFRSKRQTAGAGNKKVETLFFVTVTTVDSEGQPAVSGDEDMAADDASNGSAADNPNSSEQKKDSKVDAKKQSTETVQKTQTGSNAGAQTQGSSAEVPVP